MEEQLRRVQDGNKFQRSSDCHGDAHVGDPQDDDGHEEKDPVSLKGPGKRHLS